MISRRQVFKSLLSVPFVGTLIAKLGYNPRYELPPNHLWYENTKVEKWFPLSSKDYTDGPPEEFIYQHTRDINEVHHVIRGPEKFYYTSQETWDVSIVEAMVKSGDYKLEDAILICSIFCERCSNAMAFEYKLWGYDRNSEQFRKCNTKCNYCCKDS